MMQYFGSSYFKRKLAILMLFVIMPAGSGIAFATDKLVVHVGKGIGGVAVGMSQTKALKAIGIKPSKSGSQKDPDGKTVYYAKFGKVNKDKTYPIEIMFDSKKNVSMIAVASSAYTTDEGIKVGSTKASLTKAYGKKLKVKSQQPPAQPSKQDKTPPPKPPTGKTPPPNPPSGKPADGTHYVISGKIETEFIVSSSNKVSRIMIGNPPKASASK
jgi:hypothetical protein